MCAALHSTPDCPAVTVLHPHNIVNILFIDDEQQCVELASVYLYREFPGCSLVHALSCAMGLNLLSTSSFDVALIDQKLQETSGLDCLKLLRRRWRELPIVLVTGFDWADGFEEECIKEGADGFVHKDAMKQMLGPVILIAQRLRQKLTEFELRKAQREEHLQYAAELPENLKE